MPHPPQPKPKSTEKQTDERTEGIPTKAENKTPQSQEAAAGLIWMKPPQGWGTAPGRAHDISPDFKTLSTPQTNNTTQAQTRTSTSSQQEMGVRRSLFHDATGEWHAHSRKKGASNSESHTTEGRSQTVQMTFEYPKGTEEKKILETYKDMPKKSVWDQAIKYVQNQQARSGNSDHEDDITAFKIITAEGDEIQLSKDGLMSQWAKEG